MLDRRSQQELISILPRLRRYALSLARSQSDADDLVQFACERAISRFDQWEIGTRLDSWMFRIIQNIYIDGRRKAERQENYADLAKHQSETYLDGQQSVEAHLTLKATQNAILCLPDDQRSALFLVSVEGYSYKDAAEILGIPTGTLTSRLVRARSALVDIMRNLKGNEKYGLPGAPNGKEMANVERG